MTIFSNFCCLSVVFLIWCQSSVCSPELLTITSHNECIKDVVASFTTGKNCEGLSQVAKSELALRMTDCLLIQMGQPPLNCQEPAKCDLKGDNWNTFTTFFAHIDNLCHFYWDVSKAQRAEQITEALVKSAQHTKFTLEANSQNTQEILRMQNSLRSHILDSITNQQHMSQLLANSSLTIASLTYNISGSLGQIHRDIDSHFAVVSRVLAALDKLISNLSFMEGFMMESAHSVQGVAFFIAMLACILVSCVLSDRARVRVKLNLLIIITNFLIEFFLGELLVYFLDVQKLRLAVLAVIGLLIITVPSQPKSDPKILQALNSARIHRIMHNAVQSQMQKLNRSLTRQQLLQYLEQTEPRQINE